MANSAVAATPESKLRQQRIEIYCKELKEASCAPAAINKTLGIDGASWVPPESVRWYNFKLVVEQNFVREYDIFETRSLYSWPEHGLELIKAYKALDEYARSPYGAAVIAKILRYNQRVAKVPFEIRLSKSTSAKGYTDFIQLPADFPLVNVLKTGDAVDPLAIIHHEFGHTHFFSGHKPGKVVTIEDERMAVIHMENPARMYNRNEPRYAYYSPEFDKTINIITGEIKAGAWAFDKTDPRKFSLPR